MTTPTTLTAPTARPRTVRSLAARVVGWLLVVTGAGHATLVAVGSASPTPGDERAVRALMETTSVAVGGLERTYWQLFTGFSLVMALLLVGLGALVLLVERRAPELVEGSRAVLALLSLVLAPALVLSALLLPPPPIVLLGLGCLVAVGALVRDPASGELERSARQG